VCVCVCVHARERARTRLSSDCTVACCLVAHAAPATDFTPACRSAEAKAQTHPHEQEDVQQAHDDGRSLSDIAGDPVADFLAGLSNDHLHGRVETPAATPPTPPLSTSEDGAASDDDVVAEYLRAAGVAYD
jgi:hypothetical protein